MTDTPTIAVQPSISALDKAKEIADRISRNKQALISMSGTLEIKRSAYEYAKKRLREATEDCETYSKEIPALEHHVGQLHVWCAKHLDSDEQVQIATALAKKIERLRKELENKRKELTRLENGLPDIAG